MLICSYDKKCNIICKYIKEEEFRDIISILIDAFQLYGYIEDINDYENIFLYDAFDIKAEKTGEEALEVFNKAMDNIMPVLEVKARRVGGANY